jgi:hypothetical protein
MTADRVTIELNEDEALVLLDNKSETGFDDQAEQRVLWDLEAVLESNLAAVVDPEYQSLLAAARDRVRDPSDPASG